MKKDYFDIQSITWVCYHPEAGGYETLEAALKDGAAYVGGQHDGYTSAEDGLETARGVARCIGSVKDLRFAAIVDGILFDHDPDIGNGVAVYLNGGLAVSNAVAVEFDLKFPNLLILNPVK